MLVREVTHDLCNLLKPYDHMLLFTGANQQGGVVGRGEGLGGGGAWSGEGGSITSLQIWDYFRSRWMGDTHFKQANTNDKSVVL